MVQQQEARLCRRELEILEIIREYEEKGITDPLIPVIQEKLGMSEAGVRKFLRILLRKRVLPVEDERKFPKFSYKLAPRQKAVLKFIKDFIDENKFAPSLEEIAFGIGLKNRMGVKQHIDALRLRGFVDYEDGKNRTLRLTTNHCEAGDGKN